VFLQKYYGDAERRKTAATASMRLAIDEVRSQWGLFRKERPQTTEIRLEGRLLEEGGI